MQTKKYTWVQIIYQYCSIRWVRMCNMKNYLRPSDAILRQRTWSTLAQVVACCLTAPSHYLTNANLSSARSFGFQVRAIPQEMPQSSITEICLKITCLKFHSNFPVTNELMSFMGCILHVLQWLMSSMACAIQHISWCRYADKLAWYGPWSYLYMLTYTRVMSVTHGQCCKNKDLCHDHWPYATAISRQWLSKSLLNHQLSRSCYGRIKSE